MNTAFQTIKDVWGKTMVGGILLFLALLFLVGMSWFISRPSLESASQDRPDSKATRRLLRVCYQSNDSQKVDLDRSDLERIAKTYNLLRNEKADFEELLRLNEKCKPSPTAEALNCKQEPCSSLKDDRYCPGCVLWIPMRD